MQRAKPGQHTALRDLLIEECHRASTCAGFLGLTLAQSVDHPGGCVVLSRWDHRISLARCLQTRAGRDATAAIRALCDALAFDVLVPADPPDAAMPEPGLGVGLFASRVTLSTLRNVDAARAAMHSRTSTVQGAPGCLWVMGNLHADRSEFMYSCSGWANRAAWDAA